MSSAFFRLPTDGDSSSSSDSDVSEVNDLQPQHNDGFESLEQNTTTESLPSHGSISIGEETTASADAVVNIDRHRTNLLSALLEDFSRNRASELLNEANPGANFTRSSAEVQSLAKSLYEQVGQSLSLTGILPPNHAVNNKQVRAAYLAGIETLALGTLQAGRSQSRLSSNAEQLQLARISNQQQSLVQQSISKPSLQPAHDHLPSPYADLILSTTNTHRSHYDSSFQQLRLLGKGGFGRVYHAYNLFDKKEYAIKKIPLSPRLSQRYRDSGHKELENVLREVQALAQLEHSNVVRYHATWIEEPKRPLPELHHPTSSGLPVQGRKLIADQPSGPPPASRSAHVHSEPPVHSDGIVFGADSRSTTPAPQEKTGEPVWSVNGNDSDHEPSSARASEIFTDGHGRPSVSQEIIADDSVYVLHVQMSVYPMTLAQYLAPVTVDARSSPSSPTKRHCFHLVPALRLLLDILCGLQYIHTRGLIHRDIKPSNIFLSTLSLLSAGGVPDGYHDVGSCIACTDPGTYLVNARIGDFGLVAELVRDRGIETSTDGTTSIKPVGTEYYRPPPWTDPNGQARSQSLVDEKVDVFALGVILIELLWPCATSTERMHVLRDVQKGRPPARLAEKVDEEGYEPGISSQVVGCINGMIDRDPRRRWGCAQVKETINKILRGCWPPPVETGRDAATTDIDQTVIGKVESIDEVFDIAPEAGEQAQ